jgi:geranylgeranyl pyrophosphate synthase
MPSICSLKVQYISDFFVLNIFSITFRQNALSQITELMFAGHVLHRSVVNIIDKNSNSGLHQGNKLATLMGDLLMAKTSRRLSDLKNHTVTEIMSNTICEFSESGFIGEGVTSGSQRQHGRNNRIPIADEKPQSVVGIRPFLSYQNWIERSKQSLGAIVGNSCVSCMVLAGQEDEGIQQFASDLGRCIGILLQVSN